MDLLDMILAKALLRAYDFRRVTDFGAKGDGETDDTMAIQSALDEGGVVCFPAGVYRITQALKFTSNQILLMTGATILQGAEIDNLIRNDIDALTGAYDGTHDVLIYGGTFDGGTYSTNNALLCICHAQRIVVDSCRFVNGYGRGHEIEVNSSRDITICNSQFSQARRTKGNNTESIQLDAMTAREVYPWQDEGVLDCTPCRHIKIERNVFDVKNQGIGHHNYVAVEDVVIAGNQFVGPGSDQSSRGVSIPNGSQVSIRGNRFEGLLTGVACTTYIHNSAVSDNVFENCRTGVGLYGGDNIVSGNFFVAMTSRPCTIMASGGDQTAANNGNLVVHNVARNCGNSYYCDNGTITGNIFDGDYSD